MAYIAMQVSGAALVMLAACGAAASATTDKKSSHGLPEGHYTGAVKVMHVGRDGVVTYDDTPPGICHLEILADGKVKAVFPDKQLGRGKWHSVVLTPSGNDPRPIWTTVRDGDTYQVTAVPYSPMAYLFRLEIRSAGKLVAGAQQFYAIGGR